MRSCGSNVVQLDPPERPPPVQRPSGPSFTDLASALANVGAKRDWHFTGAIEGRPIALWNAPEKAHKSFIAIHAAIAGITGSKWLGAFQCERLGPAVYLDAEYGPHEFARRFARVCRGGGHRPEEVAPHMHHFYSRDLWLQPENDALKWIAREAARIRPTLIVIDPWRNHLPGEENSAEDTKAALNIVAQLRDSVGATVLAPHHLNKAGTYSGSRALVGRADLIVEGTDEAEPWYTARGRTIRRGDPIARPFTVRVEHDHDHDDTIARTRFTLRFEGDAVAKASLSKSALRVLDVLRGAQRPMTKNALRVAANLNSPVATRALEELRDAGQVEVEHGRWRIEVTRQAFFDELGGAK